MPRAVGAPGKLSVTHPLILRPPRASERSGVSGSAMVGRMRASVPQGKRLDESLQLIYEKVRQNSSMGVDSLNFVAQHYDIGYDTVQRVCRRYHQQEMLDPSFSLTFPQFLQVMREALGKTGGGDLKHGTADQARDLARKFQIYDATCVTPRRERMIKPRMPAMPRKEVEDSTWGPQPEARRGRTPLDTGLVTPRRLKTASFLPTTLNLTASARRTGESHLLFPNGPLRNLTSASGPKGYDIASTWHSEYMDLGRFYSEGQDLSAAGTYVPYSKFAAHQKFETEASEIGRASRRLSTGQLMEPPVRHPAEPRAWGKLGNDNRPSASAAAFMTPAEGIENLIFRVRQFIIDRGLTRFDVAAPFLHYDLHGSGIIPVGLAMSAMAELGEKVSEDTMVQLLAATGATLDEDVIEHAAYDRLVDSLVSENKRNVETLVEEDEISWEDGVTGNGNASARPGKLWPDDLRAALRILHSKVAHRSIACVPFMTEIISNDVAFAGNICPVVFSRIVAKAGTSTDHVEALVREFKTENNRLDYRALMKALEDYPSEALRLSLVYPSDHKKRKAKKSQEPSAKSESFKDPSQRNRAALEAIHAKISRKIINPGDLRLAFEKYDISRRGRITYEFFIKALAQFGVLLEEADTNILLRSMDPDHQKSIEYGRFIAMVFPPTRAHTTRKGIPMGFKASSRVMSSMSAAEQVRHLQICVEKALAKGPRELQRMLGIFRLPGDQDIELPDLKIMLMDFGLSLTDAQTLALMRHLDSSARHRIGYFKLVSGILPADCILEQGARSGLTVGTSMLHRHNPARNTLSDADFQHAMLARIKRQLVRKGPSGVPAGHQLREVLSALLCQSDVNLGDMRRAFVGVGILIDDGDLDRLMNLYRSPAHPTMRLAQFIEDIDDKAFDFVFSTGNVAGASLQRVQKELPAPAEPDALIRNKLRRVLKRRMDQDGAKSIVTVLRLHDHDRSGRLTCKALQAALFNLGLKVESHGNMQRLWGALAAGLDSNGQIASLDVMGLADLLNAPAERVHRPVPNDTPRQEMYLG